MFLVGRGVEQDEGKAEALLRKAAAQGHPDACAMLGSIYRRRGFAYSKGVEVAQDRSVASYWYQMAEVWADESALGRVKNMYPRAPNPQDDDAESYDVPDIADTIEDERLSTDGIAVVRHRTIRAWEPLVSAAASR
jgi:hypothetical protein